jgi:hypothetical protein
VSTLASTIAPRRVKGLRAGVESLRISGEEVDAKVGEAILATSLERTLDGASTIVLSLHDPNRELLNSALFKTRARLEIDGLKFRLVAVRRTGDITEVEFEDETVARLRIIPGPRKAYRDKVTRAEFAKSMVREAPGATIRFVSPELHVEQPIADSEEPEPASTIRRGVGSDFSLPAVLERYDRQYEAHIAPDFSGETMPFDHIAMLAEWAGKGDVPRIAAAQVTIGEAGRRPGAVGVDPGGTRGYGLWQITMSYHDDKVAKFGGYEAMLNPVNCALVMAEIYREAAWQPWFGTSALTTPDAHYTGPIDGSPGSFGDSDPSTRVVDRRYAFERKADETIWDALQRLANEVNWRCFASRGAIYFVDELDLLDSKVEMRVRADTEGIDSVDFDYDAGKAVSEVNLTGRARAWQAPPGCAAHLKDYGPADGRYIVASISTTLHSTDASITLERPTPPLPEPAPETKTITQGGSIADAVNGDGPTITIPSVTVESAGGDSNAIVLDDRWGGTQAIFEQFVHPFMAEYGLEPGSQKRPYNTGSGISDHFVGATNAYATDYPTFSGAAAANALGNAMGRGGSSVGTYERFTISVSGRSFSVQILWAVPDHYNHVHVGIHTV